MTRFKKIGRKYKEVAMKGEKGRTVEGIQVPGLCIQEEQNTRSTRDKIR